ncbi:MULTISPECIES: alpha/beta fold hydrolase [Azotobacter]|uniref:alpha/beta fold hydrolase n=1 Tax=Azotobacter TaxID=352 RepID=UPI0000527101|nr:alpha/beta fold hydrolase [Azotobacter vinelandii]WKN20738.1 alpha/beta hydrolase [Azotobacter vinelandii]GLK62195.1 alpha/beta hydrolase [Azotobacter vinelandii]SFX17617.1 Lysophospholipase, alpha-beta hydrolase superfamily [Azotobacter vinelandii]
MTPPPSKLLFLPGASGSTQFWRPTADLLTHPARKVHIGWPGLGSTPADPSVTGFADLVARVVAEIDQPAALMAQSMGGVVAMLAALERPEQVSHLVLAATSGGMDMASLGAQDWRPLFAAENRTVPQWFIEYHEDLTHRLAELRMPVLLLWGDADPISPVGVGQRLAVLLPRAELHVFPGAGHRLAKNLAAQVAPLIDRHLARS